MSDTLKNQAPPPHNPIAGEAQRLDSLHQNPIWKAIVNLNDVSNGKVLAGEVWYEAMDYLRGLAYARASKDGRNVYFPTNPYEIAQTAVNRLLASKWTAPKTQSAPVLITQRLPDADETARKVYLALGFS